ncbi:class I SAM-dependent methyltransferase [Mesorhizobium sp. WSM3860]|uniref:class I SAM-dependent methyltransferase n=1 Tax=Mesorhizobium sp. WSM3860 TaxID=2029403 RepID=UPI000BAEC43A|nr:class I SAM-dependent methyltransferase [Mesorhizobium sp. WSM3860]PBC05023.1 hypothetical protein CK220_08540 [Mesorhizobium sp. WSM3860]
MTEPDAAHEAIVDTWRSFGASDYEYFEKYENPELLAWFWAPASRFRKAFEQYLDLDDVLEIASGAGRHSAQIVGRCRRLTLIDTSVDATALARKRFSSAPHVTVTLSPDGKSLPFEKGRFSSVFSYDSMVHFEPLTVASYIMEVASVLKPGGASCPSSFELLGESNRIIQGKSRLAELYAKGICRACQRACGADRHRTAGVPMEWE